MNELTDPAVQELQLNGTDEENTFQIVGDLVNIYSSQSSAPDYERVAASNKIKIQPAVKFFWEYQYYIGKLICRHQFSPLIAYCINNKTPSTGGENEYISMVRLRNMETSQKLLLKSFDGQVITMEFAMRVDPTLAVLDKSRLLHVFKIYSDQSDSIYLKSDTILVLRLCDEGCKPSSHQTLTWCPWVSGSQQAVSLTPSGSMEKSASFDQLTEDSSLLLALSCDSEVMVIDVDAAVNLLTSKYPLSPTLPEVESACTMWTRDQLRQVVLDGNNTDGLSNAKHLGIVYTAMSDHKDVVTALALSRDSTRLASAALDGQVCIYSLKPRQKQVELPHGDGECTVEGSFHRLTPLVVLSPHDGQPLHGLIFIDHPDQQNDKESTWSYLITGARFNRELRLWSCKNWTCNQILRFHNSPVSVTPGDETSTRSVTSTAKPSLVLALDWSASLLVASDITRRVLYVIELSQHTIGSCGINDPSMPSLRFASISEFLLSTPCFLFALGQTDRKTDVISDSSLSSVPGEILSLQIHGIHTWHLLNSTITFSLPHWPDVHRHALQNQQCNRELPPCEQSPFKLEESEAVKTSNIENSKSTSQSEGEDNIPEYLCCSAPVRFDLGEDTSVDTTNTVSIVESTNASVGMPQPPLEVSPPRNSPSTPEDDGCYREDNRLYERPSSFGQQLGGVGNVASNSYDMSSVSALAPDVLSGAVEWAEDNTRRDMDMLYCTPDRRSPFDDIDRSAISPVATHSIARNSEPAISSEHPESLSLEPTIGQSAATEWQSAGDTPGILSTKPAATKEYGHIEWNKDEEAEGNEPSSADLDQLLLSNFKAGRTCDDHQSSVDLGLFSVDSSPAAKQMWADVQTNLTRRQEVINNSCAPQANWSTVSIYSSSSCSSPSLKGAQKDNSWRCLRQDQQAQASTEEEAEDDEEFLNLLTPTVPVTSKDILDHSGDNVRILSLLEHLVEDSKKRNEQMEFLLNKVNSTQEQLNHLTKTHIELLKTVKHTNASTMADCKGDGSSVTTATTRNQSRVMAGKQVTASEASGSVNKSVADGRIPSWGNLLLVQLRTQQGDFSRRFSQLETTINAMSSLRTDKQKKQPLHCSETIEDVNRLERLLQLTVDLMRPVIRNEVQNTFLANINRIVEPTRDHVSRAIQDSLSSLPSNVSEVVTRALREKTFANQFARAASVALNNELYTAYRDSMQRVFIPALQDGINKLFQDLNTLFQVGTQQYVHQVGERSLGAFDPDKVAKCATDQIVPAIRNVLQEALVSTASADVPSATSQHRLNQQPQQRTPTQAQPSTSNGVFHRSSFSSLQPPEIFTMPSLTNSTAPTGNSRTPAPTDSIAAGSRDQKSPAPKTSDAVSLTKKEEFARLLGQVQTYIRYDQLVQALELALISKNQALVLDVCSDIDPDHLLNSGKYPMAQNVLLSLIQQLSCGDLNLQSDIKLRYIQEAILNLDKTDPTTKEHGGRIGSLLTRRLEAFIKTLSNSASTAGSVINASPSSSLVYRTRKLLRSVKHVFDISC